jgi:alpha-L-arabinofuranosidase
MVLTPTYHVFDMYQPFMEATPFKAAVTTATYAAGNYTLPLIDVSAARAKDGKLYLAIVNTDPHRSVEVKTNLNGVGRGRIITSDKMDAHNTFAAPNRIQPVAFNGTSDGGKAVFRMPAMSVAVVAVE